MKTIQPPKHDDTPTLDLPGATAAGSTSNTPTSSVQESESPQPHGTTSHTAYTLHTPEHRQNNPLSATSEQDPKNRSHETAADLIRGKIERLYANEPAAKDEIDLLERQPGAYSKHQEFVMRLVSTGRPLSEIQDAWHAYYASLPDHEKHEVWQEFYSSYERASKFAQALMARQTKATHSEAQSEKSSNTTKPAESAISAEQTDKIERQASHHTPATRSTPSRPYSLKPAERAARQAGQLQTIAALKSQLIEKITARSRVSKGGHIKSLAFGLGMGAIFIVLVLFSFFNERFITPFIMPGKASASTRLIIDPTASTSVGPENKIIIPKLNVEVPVVYGAATIEEKDIQKELENGVVHYPITEKPGELGNNVIVGHSSNNILNKGKYKFAFLMLKKLEAGDTFYIHFNGTRYVYKVYESKIVEATDVAVLEDTDRPAVTTLITCDPPGTSLKRLIVRAEQISPEPAGNTESTAAEIPEQPTMVPGNSPSLFQRITDWIF